MAENEAPKVETAPAPQEQTPSEKLAAVAASLGVPTAPKTSIKLPFSPEDVKNGTAAEPSYAPLPERVAPPTEAGNDKLAAKNQLHTVAVPFKHRLLSAADKLAHKVFEDAHGVVIDTHNNFLNGAYRFKGVCPKCSWQTHVGDQIDAQNVVGQHSKRHGNKYVPVAKTAVPTS